MGGDFFVEVPALQYFLSHQMKEGNIDEEIEIANQNQLIDVPIFRGKKVVGYPNPNLLLEREWNHHICK